MKLGNRVEIVNTNAVNCANIPFQGLLGTVIAKSMQLNQSLWLVSFDRDICGLAMMTRRGGGSMRSGCDHDFCGRTNETRYTIIEGGMAPMKRNQHFFSNNFLKLVDAPIFAPKNNDGRSICFWCDAPTKRVPGVFVNNYDICMRCEK